MICGLLYLFDCYDEDLGEYRKPNLTHVELHTGLWFVNCVDNLGGDKESLSSLVGTVRMECNPMFVFQGKFVPPAPWFCSWHRPEFEESRGVPTGSFLDDVPQL
eukprot:scaffold176631_cov50-Attheya_sp.AAC.1